MAEKWYDKPITWKGYAKFGVYSTLVSVGLSVGYVAYYYKDEIVDHFHSKKGSKEELKGFKIEEL